MRRAGGRAGGLGHESGIEALKERDADFVADEVDDVAWPRTKSRNEAPGVFVLLMVASRNGQGRLGPSPRSEALAV